jgi:subtilisin-like proprotein convertase family protein
MGHRIALAGLILGLSSPGMADSFRATLNQPLREVSHSVDVRLVDGVATYTVRRSFANRGARHDEASLGIELPFGAAATGLRIRAARRWYRGELMERDRAAELYRELTGMGPHSPRDPALLSWEWADRVHLQVFPVPPGGTATVEYTLTAPTRYANGRHVVFYPRGGGGDLVAPVLRVHPQLAVRRGGRAEQKKETSRVSLDGAPVARAQPVILQRAGEDGSQDERNRDPGATYVVSSIDTDIDKRLASARVSVDIRHTYRGDLRVVLVTPWKARHVLHDRKGSSENDLRRTFKLRLSSEDRSRSIRGTWRLSISDHARADVGSLEGWSLALGVGAKGKRTVKLAAPNMPRALPDAPAGEGPPEGCATISIDPPPIDTVEARLGRVVAAPNKQFLRLEVDAAPELRPLPRRPSVVFVVDASHSMAEEGIRAQLDLARAFLHHVPDARFDVVLYRRHATRLESRFLAADELDRVIGAARKKGRLAPGNGSALDAGFVAAARALGDRRGPRFIVMTSDNLLRSSWKNKLSVKRLVRPARGLTAHVVIPEIGSGDVTERRNDGHDLAPLAAAYGGVLLEFGGLPATEKNRAEIRKAALGLVRPIRIDSFNVRGVKGLDLPGVLDEGQGIREMVKLARAPRRLRLTGKIWARPFSRLVKVSRRFARATAAYVFSHDMHTDLTEKEMMKVALFGRAVSPVTSYLAIEPGVRPSTAGIDRRLGSIGRGGGSGAGYGSGHGRAHLRRPDLRALLLPGVKRCVARHRPGPGWRVDLTVETTRDEIVDVVLAGRATPLSTCIVEEVWAVRLTSAFHLERDSFSVSLP